MGGKRPRATADSAQGRRRPSTSRRNAHSRKIHGTALGVAPGLAARRRGVKQPRAPAQVPRACQTPRERRRRTPALARAPDDRGGRRLTAPRELASRLPPHVLEPTLGEAGCGQPRRLAQGLNDARLAASIDCARRSARPFIKVLIGTSSRPAARSRHGERTWPGLLKTAQGAGAAGGSRLMAHNAESGAVAAAGRGARAGASCRRCLEAASLRRWRRLTTDARRRRGVAVLRIGSWG
jgi:hypothetical protein